MGDKTFFSIKLTTNVFNEDFRWACRSIHGKWDPKEKEWQFPIQAQSKAEEINQLYNCHFIEVEITFLQDILNTDQTFSLVGYPIATSSPNKTWFYKGITLIKGTTPLKFDDDDIMNYETFLIKQGTVIRMEMTRAMMKKATAQWQGKVTFREIIKGTAANDDLIS